MSEKVLVPGTMGNLFEGAKRILAQQGFEAVYLGPVTGDDIDTGLAHIDNDICLSTVAIVGQYMRYFNEHDVEEGLHVLAPELCRDCRSVSTPDVLPSTFERAGITGVKLVPFTSSQAKEAATDDGACNVATDKPVIGVTGNMPVITTDEFRHVVCAHLEESGCQVVMPPATRIADERDFLTPALRYFDEHGITTVICILPFGCLGGHVFARGQLRKLQRTFPHIELTILDYDPSASDINLVNRTELVIQSAKEKAAHA